MFSIQGFNEATKLLAEANGISLDLAGDYMAIIGDIPNVVDTGPDGVDIVEVTMNGVTVRLRYPD